MTNNSSLIFDVPLLPRFPRLVHNVKTCVLPHVAGPFNCIRCRVGWLVTLDPQAILSDQRFAVCVMHEDGRNQNSQPGASEWAGT